MKIYISPYNIYDFPGYSSTSSYSNSPVSESVSVDEMAPLGLLPHAHPVLANVSLGMPPTQANCEHIDLV